MRLLRLSTVLGVLLQTASAGAAVLCDPANPAQVRLQVSVSGMQTTKGRINISIYPDVAAEFLHGKYKLSQQRLPVVLPVTQACFVVPVPGYYAVALFGDEKDNNHFETTVLGLPAEGFGFSNNPHLYFGPPGLAPVLFPAHLATTRLPSGCNTIRDFFG